VGGEALARMARERFVLNTRLVKLLDDAQRGAEVLEAGLRERKPLELLAADARAVLAPFEEATGRRYSDGLLDVIFSRFCLGK
jgi:tRNA U34 5-carboxymethylaminomethyl modifying GTPase MnmE/TrmE